MNTITYAIIIFYLICYVNVLFSMLFIYNMLYATHPVYTRITRRNIVDDRVPHVYYTFRFSFCIVYEYLSYR